MESERMVLLYMCLQYIESSLVLVVYACGRREKKKKKKITQEIFLQLVVHKKTNKKLTNIMTY